MTSVVDHAHGPDSPAIRPALLTRGTMVTADLGRARHFYEDFLGLECVRYAADGLMVRDRDPEKRRQGRGGVYWTIDVRQVAAIGNRQNLFKHWGIDVDSDQAVDQAHDRAKALKAELGLGKVMKPRLQHGSYSFYLEDFDGNWWEIEHRPDGDDNDAVFARGDVVTG